MGKSPPPPPRELLTLGVDLWVASLSSVGILFLFLLLPSSLEKVLHHCYSAGINGVGDCSSGLISFFMDQWLPGGFIWYECSINITLEVVASRMIAIYVYLLKEPLNSQNKNSHLDVIPHIEVFPVVLLCFCLSVRNSNLLYITLLCLLSTF